MNPPPNNPAVRKGQFLWMDEAGQQTYIQGLIRKVTERFYFSEKVIAGIVEELAPVLGEIVEYDDTCS